MKVSLQEMQHILFEFRHLQSTLLASEEQIRQFCQDFQYHTLQKDLTAESLQEVLKQVEPDMLLLLTDCFHIRFLFAQTDEGPVVIGPFCTETYSPKEWEAQEIHEALYQIPATEILAYRSRFPIVELDPVLHDARVFLKLCCGERRHWRFREIDHRRVLQLEADPHIVYLHRAMLEERYRLEQEMYTELALGHGSEAVRLNHLLSQRLTSQGGRNATLQQALMSVGRTRNAARITAYNCGVPAVILDDLATVNRQKIHEATSSQEIYALLDELLLSYAAAIRRQQKNKYSKLIHSLLYTIENNYREELSVAGLAAELGVSPETLNRRCKQETGLTPNAYIRRIRMNRAAQLLRDSAESIQDISAEVGILDANYFAKLFKQEFGQTPSAYRAERLL